MTGYIFIISVPMPVSYHACNEERDLYNPSPPPSDHDDSDDDESELNDAEIDALQRAYEHQLSFNM